MGISVKVISSGSRGNSTLVWNDSSSLLIDCGVSMRYTLRVLGEEGIAPGDLSGILMTHTHGDHIKAPILRRLVNENVPILCNPDTRGDYFERFKFISEENIRTYCSYSFSEGGFSVDSFEVVHDSEWCYGFSIRAGRKKVTIATDLSGPEDALITKFADSDIILIESNHDPALLMGSPRPFWLKERIKNSHLSNPGAAAFIQKVLKASKILPSYIILTHLSPECNSRRLASECMKRMLSQNGLSVPVLVAKESEALSTVKV